MPFAWSPTNIPDTQDPVTPTAGAAGVVIAPAGIASLEAFGSAVVSLGSTTFLPGYLEFFGWNNADFYAGITRQQFAAGVA